MTAQPEFSRPIEAESIREAPRTIEIDADADERRRLAGRFRLQAIDRLSASVRLQRRADMIHADGLISAQVVQSCVVTGDPLPQAVEAPFAVRYVPESAADAGEELELSEQDCDTLPLEGGRIDLGELAAETLSLALDPYPRSEAADAALHEAGVLAEGEAGPFSALRALKDRMGRKD